MGSKRRKKRQLEEKRRQPGSTPVTRPVQATSFTSVPDLRISNVAIGGNFFGAGISIPAGIEAEFQSVSINGTFRSAVGIEIRDSDPFPRKPGR